MKTDRKNIENVPIMLVNLLETLFPQEQTKLLLLSLTMGFCACSSGVLHLVSFGRFTTFCPFDNNHSRNHITSQLQWNGLPETRVRIFYILKHMWQITLIHLRIQKKTIYIHIRAWTSITKFYFPAKSKLTFF